MSDWVAVPTYPGRHKVRLIRLRCGHTRAWIGGGLPAIVRCPVCGSSSRVTAGMDWPA
jgi:hypothetical protein